MSMLQGADKACDATHHWHSTGHVGRLMRDWQGDGNCRECEPKLSF